ncbi:hypothetical protein RchiOBHm_Chr7g0215081 [Rosa chinensis]|uniref:Uncharacterized protein n=1 Tax=Rosa chinensis TaxID=74649 RepID=A0A2P6PBE7_ROSCH|nr:hypothetical protein RchiOBHm_Chr7g0215081 [Rosa chinensis]
MHTPRASGPLLLYNVATTPVSAQQCRKERLDWEILLEWEGRQKMNRENPLLDFLPMPPIPTVFSLSFISILPFLHSVLRRIKGK